MKNKGSRVHIAVLGYELDRITEVPIEIRTDKVYIITRNEDKESPEAVKFLNECINRLEDNKIKTFIRRNEPLNLENIIVEMKKIIKFEKMNEVREIYINVSSGSSVGAIAGTICAMLFSDENTKITPYYVIPNEHYENLSDEEKLKKQENYRKLGYDGIMPRSFGVYGIEYVTPFNISLPDEKLMIFAKRIYEMERESEYGVSMKKIAKLVIETKESQNLIKLITEPENKEEEEYNKKLMEDLLKKYKKLDYGENEILTMIEENYTILKWRKMRMGIEKGDEENIKRLQREKPEPVDYVWLKQNVISKLQKWEMIEIPEDRIGGYKRVKLTKKGEDLVKYLY
nr:DUF6293 family protein [Methanococcus voltae]